jgi:hypothetical protein
MVGMRGGIAETGYLVERKSQRSSAKEESIQAIRNNIL